MNAGLGWLIIDDDYQSVYAYITWVDDGQVMGTYPGVMIDSQARIMR